MGLWQQFTHFCVLKIYTTYFFPFLSWITNYDYWNDLFDCLKFLIDYMGFYFSCTCSFLNKDSHVACIMRTLLTTHCCSFWISIRFAYQRRFSYILVKMKRKAQLGKSRSWWWDSYISPQNSKWLSENLEGKDCDLVCSPNNLTCYSSLHKMVYSASVFFILILITHLGMPGCFLNISVF